MENSIIAKILCRLLNSPGVIALLRKIVQSSGTPVDDLVLELLIAYCQGAKKNRKSA